MSHGSIVFVHGTGVRLKSYVSTYNAAVECAKKAGIGRPFVECAWGDGLGVDFKGLSLPDKPTAKQLADDEEDFAQWRWLFDDPLFELQQLTIAEDARDAITAGAASNSLAGAAKQAPALANPRFKPEWLQFYEKVAAYTPTDEFQLLLDRGGLTPYWQEAWTSIIGSGVPRDAFKASPSALADTTRALARALVAALHVAAVEKGSPGPSRALRQSLLERLARDWGNVVYGLGTYFATLMKRGATRMLRAHRNGLSNVAALPIGDVLLYQTRGKEIRSFIRKKIESAAKPVAVVAHSLGGIACVDLLAESGAPSVAQLVTAGSQAPLLYELGALSSLKSPAGLPAGFPPWLNLFDRNDFLSYVAGRLFTGAAVKDVEVASGQPFPDSHSAYFANPDVWVAILGVLP